MRQQSLYEINWPLSLRTRTLTVLAVLLLACLNLKFFSSHSPDFPAAAMNGSQSQSHTCAAWLSDEPKTQRKVLFYRVPTMKQFYQPLNFKGGEYYVFACLDYALQQNGFVVETTSRPLDWFSAEKLASYHRIFVNRPSVDQFQVLQDHPELFCKVRALHFFGNWLPPINVPVENQTQLQLHPRQVLSPYPDLHNTFMGFFVHSLLYNEQTDNPQQQQIGSHTGSSSAASASRGKKGLIVGKIGRLFKPHHITVMEALIGNGYTLYSVCQDDILNHCGMPQQVIIQRYMAPRDYAALMQQMSFLIGFGDPIVSPSPLEGLAHGAAWLNPIRVDDATPTQQALKTGHWTIPTPIQTMHNPLALLGMPYVYNINLHNVSSVLEAAQWADKYRFESYTPWEFRPEAMVARACAMMEDEALCQCPNHPFNQKKTGEPGMGCQGSHYVRNFPLQ